MDVSKQGWTQKDRLEAFCQDYHKSFQRVMWYKRLDHLLETNQTEEELINEALDALLKIQEELKWVWLNE